MFFFNKLELSVHNLQLVDHPNHLADSNYLSFGC